MQALEDTVLGADLSARIADASQQAGDAFLQPTAWKIASASLRLPRVDASSRQRAHDAGEPAICARSRSACWRTGARTRAKRNDLLGRLVSARDPGTGEAMPDSLIVDNVVTFLMVGQETTAQALTWTLYLLALFPEWQETERARRCGASSARAGRTRDRLQAACRCSRRCSRKRCGSIRRRQA